MLSKNHRAIAPAARPPPRTQHNRALRIIAHVGEARGKPDPRPGRRRDHRPASAANTRRNGSTSTAVLTPITIPFGSLISIGRSPALTDPGNAAAERSFAISTG